jgi:hypothetical protein
MDRFTTSRGIEVEFRPVSKELMLRFNAANPQPHPPTYPVTSPVTGATQDIEIDARSIAEKPEQFTPEQHAAWKEYAVKQSDFVMRFVRFFCMRGLHVKATMEDWVEEQKFLNIPMPEGKAERRFEWLTNEVLETEDDYKAVILGVIEASGVPVDLLKQVEESFRGDVQRDATPAVGNGGQQVESVTELRGSEGDVPLSVDPEPVGKTKRARSRVGHANAGNT